MQKKIHYKIMSYIYKSQNNVKENTLQNIYKYIYHYFYNIVGEMGMGVPSPIPIPIPISIWGWFSSPSLPISPFSPKKFPPNRDRGARIWGPRGNWASLIVAMDYFMKWVEAEPLVHIPEANTTNFMKNNILYRLEIPNTIITDNETQFDNKKLRELCKKY